MTLPKHPVHTPYDGSSKPFIIGLRALEDHHFIEIDDSLLAYLNEKDRLTATIPHEVIVAEPGSEAAQQEVLDLVASTVCAQYPQIYRRTGSQITIAVDGRTIDLADNTFPPIHAAARLVQEDLVLMRKGAEDWHLSAASVCFPSAWTLREKYLRPMHEIHKPVPGFGQGTRNAGLIARMFDNLRPGLPVIRWNWSFYGDNALFHPVSDHGMKVRFGNDVEPRNINLRLERQTLQKLPVSGAILFTIRIHIDPLEAMETHPDAAALAGAIIDQLHALSPDEVQYKGLAGQRERLIKRLSKVAGLPPRV